MAKEVRFVLLHAALGAFVGWVALGLILWSDVGSLGTLLATSPFALEAIALLAMGFGVTFGSAALGAAVISLGRPAEPPGGYRLRPGPVASHRPAFAARPVVVAPASRPRPR